MLRRSIAAAYAADCLDSFFFSYGSYLIADVLYAIIACCSYSAGMSTNAQIKRGCEQGYFSFDESEPLSSVAKAFFQENGFVILTKFCGENDTSELRAAASKIISDFRASPSKSASVFTTAEQDQKVLAKYFLDSASSISCFLEEKQLTDSRAPAVNKIGHALHELNPSFARFSKQKSILSIASALALQRPVLVQSMYILKNPYIGGEVKSHRDATFVYSVRGDEAPTGACLGFWWALEDATEENGCLWAVPGSHRDKLGLRFEKNAAKNGTLFSGKENVIYEENKFVPLPMRTGDLVLLHGGVVHMSKENKSRKSRHAYSIHLVDEAISPQCWLERPLSMPFQVLD